MIKFLRKTAGLYTYGEWVVTAAEGEQKAPGYEWRCEHPEKGEHFFRTLREAKTFVKGC